MKAFGFIALFVLFPLFFSCAQGGGKDTPANDPALQENVVYLDVRTAEEFSAGHIPNALLLPFNQISTQSAQDLLGAKDTPIVIYCRSGNRSRVAFDALKKLGYTNLKDLGGIGNWNGELSYQ